MNMRAAKQKGGGEGNERVEVNVDEFIPFACHYNRHTVITKNGELMQIIKVTGFAFESVHKDETQRLTIRQAIRKAIRQSIKTDNFALYFHTLRRKHDLSTEGEYPPGFARSLNASWCARHDWEHKYINELYVTVVIEGQDLSMKDMTAFLRGISYKKELRYRMGYLENAAQQLEEAVDNILSILKEYGARRLEVVKDEDNIYYSELSGFLSKIVNLKYESIPLASVDLSYTIPSHQISFGFNVLEVKGDSGRHFGAILTVKEYHEISSKAIDQILQVPQQLVVTETFDFIHNKLARDAYKKQERYQNISGDELLPHASCMHSIIASDQGGEVDFGEHQITIMVLEDTIPLLEQGMQDAVDAMHRIGVPVFREDILMEDAYWSQLPGNFEFNKRMTYINTGHVGGYASLYNFPAGKLDENHWGPAVTVFYTAMKTPYFFNFHYGDNGHTFLVGPFGAGKTVLMNFLVSESLKFNPTIWFFDQQQGSEIFIRAIGGDYRYLTRDRETMGIRFNPLRGLEDTEDDRQFVREWITYLLEDEPGKLSDEDTARINRAVEIVFSLEENNRNLSSVLPHVWEPYRHDEEDAAAVAPMPGQELPEGGELQADSAVAEYVDEKVAAALAAFDSVEEMPEVAPLPQEEDAALGSGIAGEATMVPPMPSGAVAGSEIPEQEGAGEGIGENTAAPVDADDLTAQAAAAAEVSKEERMSFWYGDGKFAHIFDNEEDGMDNLSAAITGFEMGQMVEESYPLIPLMLYLLRRIEQSLNGDPTIIVLDEAWSLMDNAAFKRHLGSWLDRLKAKNTMVIFATESVEQAEESDITKALADKIKTKIFLPNPNASKSGYANVFGLTENAYQMLLVMEASKRQFLLIHDIDAVVAELSLEGMDVELSVLSSNLENISLMKGAIRDSSSDPIDWLPVFAERLCV